MSVKSAFIVDFDDTLVKTKAKVYVTHSNGNKSELDPAEYAVYEKQDGDKFDYSDFEQLKEPEPIHRYVKLLKKALNNKRIEKITVLTARNNTLPIAVFLRSQGITGGVNIAAIGDSNPQRKANYIEKQINSGFNRILFIDDSPKNISSVKSLKHKYPDTTLLVHQVGDASEKDHKVTSSNSKLLNQRIINPVTGRKILVKTALGYKKISRVYTAARNLLRRKI